MRESLRAIINFSKIFSVFFDVNLISILEIKPILLSKKVKYYKRFLII